MTSSHGRSGNLSENFFRNSREFAVALKLAFLNLERLPFGVMSVQDVPRPRLPRVPPATTCATIYFSEYAVGTPSVSIRQISAYSSEYTVDLVYASIQRIPAYPFDYTDMRTRPYRSCVNLSFTCSIICSYFCFFSRSSAIFAAGALLVNRSLLSIPFTRASSPPERSP